MYSIIPAVALIGAVEPRPHCGLLLVITVERLFPEKKAGVKVENAPGSRPVEWPDDELYGKDQASLKAVPSNDLSLVVGDGEMEVDRRHTVIVPQ